MALLAGVANGDTRALRHLYEAHAGWVAARLRRKLPPDAVEDVLQETFVAVWRGAGGYRGSGDVGGWIWGIARFRMARWYRDHGQQPAGMVDEWVPDAGDLAGEVAERLDLDRAFAAGRPNPRFYRAEVMTRSRSRPKRIVASFATPYSRQSGMGALGFRRNALTDF